jgi:hypothetical protein
MIASTPKHLHQEVRRAHARLDRAEGVLDVSRCWHMARGLEVATD